MTALSLFLGAAIRTATPLLLAALGEMLVEYAGIINIGLEGAILGGAFGSLVGGHANGLVTGYVAGTVAGMLVACVLALFVVRFKVDQIISGTALTLLAAGVTGSLYRLLFGSAGIALTLPTSSPVAIPGLVSIPGIGTSVFTQPVVTYVGYVLIPAAWWFLYRTHAGLALRAIGERPDAARAAGVRVRRMQTVVLLAGGALGGLAGATLVLAQAGTFVEGMSAGRGFIAIAIVVLGRWHPVGIAIAAFLFGVASATQYVFQAMGWHIPYQIFLALPYLLTLAALAGTVGRARSPATLGKPLRDV